MTDLPEPVIAKIGAYTLACNCFTAHLSALGSATKHDTRLTVQGLCDVFDASLAQFFRGAAPGSLLEAVFQLTSLLHSQIALFQRTSPASAAVFEDVLTEIAARVSGWDYSAEIYRMYDLGCELARRFFAHSPYAITQERCKRSCPLVLVYGAMDAEADDLSTSELSFGYRVAPVAFHPRSGDVFVRFTFENCLQTYLAYPFMFLHEYTAHVYSTDYGNTRFNDGWMLYAAERFLRQLWRASDPLIASLSRLHINIFSDYLLGIMRNSNLIAARGCEEAMHFDAWLEESAANQFDLVTYALAAFEPDLNRTRSWPTRFLNELEEQLDLRDRSAVQDSLRRLAPDLDSRRNVSTEKALRESLGVERLAAIFVPPNIQIADSAPEKLKTLAENVTRKDLHNILVKCFNELELRKLCDLELGYVDYDNLAGEGKEAKALELVRYSERHGWYQELIDVCFRLRPNGPWPKDKGATMPS